MSTYKDICNSLSEKFPTHTFTVERQGCKVKWFDNITGALVCVLNNNTGVVTLYENN